MVRCRRIRVLESARSQSPSWHDRSDRQITIAAANMIPIPSPTLFKKPAVGLPRRTESTAARGTATRQLSHPGDLVNGTPLMESGAITSACRLSRIRRRRAPAEALPWSFERVQIHPMSDPVPLGLRYSSGTVLAER